MANDDARRTMASLLADVGAGSGTTQPARQLVDDLLSSLGLKRTAESPNLVSEQALGELWAAPGPQANGEQGRVSSPAALTEPMSRLTQQLAELTSVARAQSETVDANTQAVIENSLAQATGDGKSTAASIGKNAFSYLRSGLGLVQLLGNFFNRGGEETESTLTSYSLPAAVDIEAGLSGLGLQPIRYGQDGLPRAAPASALQPVTPITIQVQAMDSRSFMDHSAEIASAVKDALLNSHSLNDVVLEL